jgi:hypothetical protein
MDLLDRVIEGNHEGSSSGMPIDMDVTLTIMRHSIPRTNSNMSHMLVMLKELLATHN